MCCVGHQSTSGIKLHVRACGNKHYAIVEGFLRIALVSHPRAELRAKGLNDTTTCETVSLASAEPFFALDEPIRDKLHPKKGACTAVVLAT